MKRFLAVIILASAFTLGIMLTTSCSKSSDGGSGGGTSLKIPNMTATVSGTSTMAMSKIDRRHASEDVRQQSGILFSGTAPSDPLVGSVFNMVNSFVTNAKTADTFACMIEVLAGNGLIQTDGSAAVFSDDQSNEFKLKFVVNASGSTLQNFKMFMCSANGVSNELFVEGVLNSENMSFTMKYDFAGTLKGVLALDGTWNGTNWSTKNLSMETFLGASTSLVSKFVISQSTDNILFKGTTSTGTASTSYQIYSKFGLLGNSPATYAMDAGSMKYSVGSTVDATAHWDSTGSTSATTSPYAADVTSGTHFPTNISFTGDMTTDQTWDCATGSATEVKVTSMSSGAITAIQSCSENQQ